VRKVPVCSGSSLRLSCAEFGEFGSNGTFFFTLGPLKISGAKNPACKANSARAFPDGRRQLIGSIHSIGSGGIPPVDFREPIPGFRGDELPALMASSIST